jgi:hypothetical protein
MEVKMFVCSNSESAEKEAAHWLAQNPVTITHIAQSQSERGGAFVFVLTLFYTKKAAAVHLIQESKALVSLG